MQTSVESHIKDAKKGQEYTCPFCQGKMKVKEGSNIAKHFFHLKETCAESLSQDYYYHSLAKYFGLSGGQAMVLTELHGKFSYSKIEELCKKYGVRPRKSFNYFLEKDLIAFEEIITKYRYAYLSETKLYRLTSEGGIFKYNTDLRTVKNVLWEDIIPKILEAKHITTALNGYKSIHGFVNHIELGKYADIATEHFYTDLYVVHFKHQNIFKIGITKDFSRRLLEIKHDAKKYFGYDEKQDECVDFVFEKLGFCESFLKRRFEGSLLDNEFGLTEWFEFYPKSFLGLIDELSDLLKDR